MTGGPPCQWGPTVVETAALASVSMVRPDDASAPAENPSRCSSTTQGDQQIGESLFTLFASLTYAYHYLMTLIK